MDRLIVILPVVFMVSQKVYFPMSSLVHLTIIDRPIYRFTDIFPDI